MGTSNNKKDVEPFCCLIYVYFLVKAELLNFPMDVIWDNSPDFAFSFANSSIGLEVTTATDQGYLHAISVSPKDSLIEMPEYKFNATSKKTVKRGIRNPGESLQSNGWAGYGMEKQWIECVKRSIIEKTELLNKPHFKKFNANELVIYDHTPTVCPDLNYAISHMNNIYQEQINKHEVEIFFDKIHVIMRSNRLLYDLFGSCRDIDISKASI